MKKSVEMKKHDTHHQHQTNILQEFVHVSNIFNYHSDAQRQKMDLFTRNDGKWRLSARPEQQETTHIQSIIIQIMSCKSVVVRSQVRYEMTMRKSSRLVAFLILHLLLMRFLVTHVLKLISKISKSTSIYHFGCGEETSCLK